MAHSAKRLALDLSSGLLDLSGLVQGPHWATKKQNKTTKKKHNKNKKTQATLDAMWRTDSGTVTWEATAVGRERMMAESVTVFLQVAYCPARWSGGQVEVAV